MFIIKTLAHYANEVSARIAVIKRKYILYGVAERGKERGRSPFKKQYDGKLNPNAYKFPVRLCGCACVRSLCHHTHYIYDIKYKI